MSKRLDDALAYADSAPRGEQWVHVEEDVQRWRQQLGDLFPPKTVKYSEDQPRDDHGRWGEGSGGKEGAKAEFQRLKASWAQVNNDLLGYLDKPDSPEATAKVQELKDIVKAMYRVDADPGGLEGIGLPGGPRDMVIVGAGPGGLAAGVMGGVDGLDTLVIDANTQAGGQAKFTSRIENYPGFPVGTSGEKLATSMFEQAQRVGAETMLGVRVTGMSYDEKTGLKTITLSDGRTVEARSVVIAGGVEFRKLEFPGADSQSIVYGDGQRLMEMGRGKTVVVLGGSNGAAQAALGAARTAKDVYIISRSPIDKAMSDYQVTAMRNHPRIHVIENDEIAQLFSDEHGNSHTAQLRSGRRIDAHAVGVFIGGAPNLSWLPKGTRLHEGKIHVDGNLETTIPGVFAVGDARHGSIGRIGSAVGDGQMAERNVWQYFSRLQHGGHH